jgi:hypothetical protein
VHNAARVLGRGRATTCLEFNDQDSIDPYIILFHDR